MQALLAQRRLAAASRPGKARPPATDGPAGRVRRAAAVRADRRAAGGRREDRRRPGRRRTRCTGCCRARSARARRSARCGRCCRSSTPAARPRCSRRPRCSPPSTPARCRDLLGPLAAAGELDARRARDPGRAADRLAAAAARRRGAGRGRLRRGRHRGRHPRAALRGRRLRRPRPGRGRRAAPLRRRAARRAAGQGRAAAARAGDDRDADPAHGRDDRVRRPRDLHAARAAARPVADRLARGAGGGEAGLPGPGLAADARGGRGRATRRTWSARGSAATGDGGRRPTEPSDEDGEARRPPLAVLDVAPLLAEGPLHGPAGRRPARPAAGRREGRGDARVRRRRARRAGRDHGDRGRRRRAERDRDGRAGRRPVRRLPAAPAARPGRPGLGAPGSACWSPRPPAGTPARERLDAVASTVDGFELAELDLEQRREGDVLGEAQSGRSSPAAAVAAARPRPDQRRPGRGDPRSSTPTPSWPTTPAWPPRSPRWSSERAEFLEKT